MMEGDDTDPRELGLQPQRRQLQSTRVQESPKGSQCSHPRSCQGGKSVIPRTQRDKLRPSRHLAIDATKKMEPSRKELVNNLNRMSTRHGAFAKSTESVPKGSSRRLSNYRMPVTFQPPGYPTPTWACLTNPFSLAGELREREWLANFRSVSYIPIGRRDVVLRQCPALGKRTSGTRQ